MSNSIIWNQNVKKYNIYIIFYLKKIIIMKNNIKKSVRIFFLSIYIIGIVWLTNISQAQNWETYSWNDIKVIPRTERWADSEWLFYINKWYTAVKKKLWLDKPKVVVNSANSISWLANWYISLSNSWAVIKPIKKTNSEIADERVIKTYPQEYKLDNYITWINNKKLFWPIWTKSNKTKIIIHHTAWELSEWIAEISILDKLIDILKFHSFSRGWWDIGYNFLIWPAGQIYEWRAGWVDAVWAHASFNNTESIWISLMWNYNNNAPSPEQYTSLIKLIISVAKKYNINVYDRKVYHKSSKNYPYVIDVENDSIVWHKDAWNTSCPGKYIYEDMDYIKFAVNKWIGKYDIMISTEYILSKTEQVIPLQISYLNRYNANFKNRILNSDGLSCNSDDNKINTSCEISGDQINMNVKNNWYDLNSIYNVKISNSKWEWYNIYMRLSWYSDSQSQYSKIQSIYENKIGKISFPNKSRKINTKIEKAELANSLTKNISVMLYDLSTSYNNYNLRCINWCSVDIYNDDDKFTWDKISTIDIDTKSSDKINIYNNEQIYKADKIIITPKTLTQFTNYQRNSRVKFPRNIFSWQIIIEKQNIRKLDGKWYEQRSVINKLPLYDYILWIAESNDNEPSEKMKMMTILTKQYALYYIDKKNEHAYISSGSNFALTDDPRISQKYIWAWFVSKKRWQAVNETRNQVIMYDDHLPILPYFSCSAWFTRWAEKFWRNDTPYLVGKLDPWWYCDDGKWNFAWHGVWVSGKWAATMAKKWYSYKQILQYYYDNIKITDLTSGWYR